MNDRLLMAQNGLVLLPLLLFIHSSNNDFLIEQELKLC